MSVSLLFYFNWVEQRQKVTPQLPPAAASACRSKMERGVMGPAKHLDFSSAC